LAFAAWKSTPPAWSKRTLYSVRKCFLPSSLISHSCKKRIETLFSVSFLCYSQEPLLLLIPCILSPPPFTALRPTATCNVPYKHSFIGLSFPSLFLTQSASSYKQNARGNTFVLVNGKCSLMSQYIHT